MRALTVDVALGLPDALRQQTLQLSSVLVERMRQRGHRSRFQLGGPFPGDADDGVCEPHVSLFMLQVAESDLDEVLTAVRSVASHAPAIIAEGAEYRHNPHGAPELYFHGSDSWNALQRAVIAAVEPVRRERLRERDPSGERLVDVIERLRREQPHGTQLRQLLAYGYDEVSDHTGDRFNPHVTLAWPTDPFDVDLDDLPAAKTLGAVLADLAVYGMNGSGTCTRRYGGFALHRDANPPPQGPNGPIVGARSRRYYDDIPQDRSARL